MLPLSSFRPDVCRRKLRRAGQKKTPLPIKTSIFEKKCWQAKFSKNVEKSYKNIWTIVVFLKALGVKKRCFSIGKMVFRNFDVSAKVCKIDAKWDVRSHHNPWKVYSLATKGRYFGLRFVFWSVEESMIFWWLLRRLKIDKNLSLERRRAEKSAPGVLRRAKMHFDWPATRERGVAGASRKGIIRL